MLPLPARWLIHCEGRPTLNRSASTAEEAQLKARALADEWPGHDFDIYERVDSHSTSRNQTRPARPVQRF